MPVTTFPTEGFIVLRLEIYEYQTVRHLSWTLRLAIYLLRL